MLAFPTKDEETRKVQTFFTEIEELRRKKPTRSTDEAQKKPLQTRNTPSSVEGLKAWRKTVHRKKAALGLKKGTFLLFTTGVATSTYVLV